MLQHYSVSWKKGLAALCLLAVAGLSCCDQQENAAAKVEYDGLSNSQPLRVDANNHTVTMLVQINGRFLTDDTRHGIVFKDGSNGHKSLFMGYATPKAFYEALKEAGGTPGENMTMDTDFLRENHLLFRFFLRLRCLLSLINPGTYVRPHRHPHTFELLLPLRGRFVVLNFDDRGTVTHRAILGETCTVLEMAAGTWHAVLSLDTGGIIFEVKHGGYQPVAADDYAHWAPAEGEPGTTELMAWYAQAQVGDSTFAV